MSIPSERLTELRRTIAEFQRVGVAAASFDVDDVAALVEEVTRLQGIIEAWSNGESRIDGILICTRCKRPILDDDSVMVGSSHWHPRCHRLTREELREECLYIQRTEDAEKEATRLRQVAPDLLTSLDKGHVPTLGQREKLRAALSSSVEGDAPEPTERHRKAFGDAEQERDNHVALEGVTDAAPTGGES